MTKVRIKILVLLFLVYSNTGVSQNNSLDSILLVSFNELQKRNQDIQMRQLRATEYQLEMQQQQEQKTLVYMAMFGTILFALGFYFFLFWRKNEEKKLRFEIDKVKRDEDREKSENQQGGFIFIEMGEKEKQMFHDLLKGFEDYAKLKGYSISFSIDNSLPNKVGFKFTILDTGITVSPNTVRSDIQEYINNVKNDEPLDNLPVVISPQEHELVLTVMKNRISFLKHNYELEKNAKEFYIKFIKDISSSNPVYNHPSIFVQTGGNNIPQLNSGNSLINSSNKNINNSTSNTIKISNSFNKRKEQINKIEEISKLIRADKETKEEIKEEVIRNLLNIKEELEENEEPDKSRIKKGLEKTKSLMSTMVLTHKTAKALQWLFESFELVGTTLSGIG